MDVIYKVVLMKKTKCNFNSLEIQMNIENMAKTKGSLTFQRMQ